MSKKGLKITCIVSCLLFLSIVACFVITALQMQNEPSVAIIGGADAPTSIFIAEKAGTLLFHNPLFMVGIVSFALFVISLILLLVKRFRKR